MLAIDLSGKTALVTGGSGNLGRVMVRTLARAGADVAVHYLKNKTKADELVREVQAMGRQAIAVQADITEQASVEAMRDQVGAQLAAPDIIVNNAVIQYKWVHVLDQALADFESQFRSCVLHNVLMAKTFVPAMIERGWGRVIAISTACAMQCTPNQAAYVSGKRGMDGVLRALAREIGPHGITVNQVAPGWTVSDGSIAGQGDAEYVARLPLRRRGTDQEIANVVAFVASDLSSYITGAYLPVSGGDVMPTI